MKHDGNDHFILESGKRFYAHALTLGIAEYEGRFDVAEGYDGGVDTDKFTLQDRREVAEYMIDLWGRWARA